MSFNRSKLFRDAWAYAKAFSAFDHSSPRARLGDALRKVWAEAKARFTAVQVASEPRAVDIDASFGWRPRYSRLRAAYNPW